MPNVSYIYVNMHFLRGSIFPDFNWTLILHYRSGSTVVEYLVRATSFLESEIAAAEAGIVTRLSDTYPMIVDSKTIRLCLVAPCPPFITLSFFNAHCFWLPFSCVCSLKVTHLWRLNRLKYFLGMKSDWRVVLRQMLWTLEEIGQQNGHVIALLSCQMVCTVFQDYQKRILPC